jgi:hypothetical protein
LGGRYYCDLLTISSDKSGLTIEGRGAAQGYSYGTALANRNHAGTVLYSTVNSAGADGDYSYKFFGGTTEPADTYHLYVKGITFSGNHTAYESYTDLSFVDFYDCAFVDQLRYGMHANANISSFDTCFFALSQQATSSITNDYAALQVSRTGTNVTNSWIQGNLRGYSLLIDSHDDNYTNGINIENNVLEDAYQYAIKIQDSSTVSNRVPENIHIISNRFEDGAALGTSGTAGAAALYCDAEDVGILNIKNNTFATPNENQQMVFNYSSGTEDHINSTINITGNKLHASIRWYQPGYTSYYGMLEPDRLPGLNIYDNEWLSTLNKHIRFNEEGPGIADKAFMCDEIRVDKTYMNATGVSQTGGNRYVLDVKGRYVRAFQVPATGSIYEMGDVSGYSGSQTTAGGNNSDSLTASESLGATDGLLYRTLVNSTDGSFCFIQTNTASTATGNLRGGVDNDWDIGDNYDITREYYPLYQLYLTSNNTGYAINDRVRAKLTRFENRLGTFGVTDTTFDSGVTAFYDQDSLLWTADVSRATGINIEQRAITELAGSWMTSYSHIYFDTSTPNTYGLWGQFSYTFPEEAITGRFEEMYWLVDFTVSLFE